MKRRSKTDIETTKQTQKQQKTTAISQPLSQSNSHCFSIDTFSTPQHKLYSNKLRLPDDVCDIDDCNVAYDGTYARSVAMLKHTQEAKFAINDASRLLGSTIFQPDITLSMHSVLVDWILEAAEEHSVESYAFCLAIHMLDLYLARGPVVHKLKFQLLGCACLLLASKLEQMASPTVEEIVRTADYCFTDQQLCEMEICVLQLLDFDIASIPTRQYFLNRFMKAASLEKDKFPREYSFASMLIDLSMQDFSLNCYSPSLVAAACVHLTRQTLRPKSEPLWTHTLEFYTSFNEAQLVDAVLILQSLHWNAATSQLVALKRKYESPAQYKCSKIHPLLAQDIRFDFRPTLRHFPCPASYVSPAFCASGKTASAGVAGVVGSIDLDGTIKSAQISKMSCANGTDDVKQGSSVVAKFFFERDDLSSDKCSSAESILKVRHAMDIMPQAARQGEAGNFSHVTKSVVRKK